MLHTVAAALPGVDTRHPIDLVRYANLTVAMYHYLNSWFGMEPDYRNLAFFDQLARVLVPLEHCSPDVWHILNCSQNAYEDQRTAKLWELYLEATRSGSVV